MSNPSLSVENRLQAWDILRRFLQADDYTGPMAATDLDILLPGQWRETVFFKVWKGILEKDPYDNDNGALAVQIENESATALIEQYIVPEHIPRSKCFYLFFALFRALTFFFLLRPFVNHRSSTSKRKFRCIF